MNIMSLRLFAVESTSMLSGANRAIHPTKGPLMHAQKASITGIDPVAIPLSKTRGHAFVTVTPAIAQRWMEFNTANRKIVREHLLKITRQMTCGMWRDNGDAIRFAAGKLLDGQHRLTAIIETGLSFGVSVEYGLDPETQDTMDTGRHRTPQDVLSIEGLGAWESRTLGSAVHTLISVDSGGVVYSTKKYSNAEAKHYYLEHYAAIDRSLRVIRNLPRKANILPMAVAFSMHYLFSRASEVDADSFFEQLFSGENLSKESSIFHLRNRLVHDAIDGRKRSNYERMGFIVKAWNNYRSGRPMRSDTALYVKTSADFPEIK